jgi:hypothetical protein
MHVYVRACTCRLGRGSTSPSPAVSTNGPALPAHPSPWPGLCPCPGRGRVVVIYVCVNIRRVRSRVCLVSYLTSDIITRPVPPILFFGRVFARILVEMGEGVIYA